MTVLLLCAQDIRAFSMAIIRDGIVAAEETLSATPETYLKETDRLLKAWNVHLSAIDAVAVVVGPGAFAASRVSTVIANTIAFVHRLPVVPIENPDRLVLHILAKNRVFELGIGDRFAVPVYDRPPHIT